MGLFSFFKKDNVEEIKNLILRLIEKIVKLAKDAFQSVQTTVL